MRVLIGIKERSSSIGSIMAYFMQELCPFFTCCRVRRNIQLVLVYNLFSSKDLKVMCAQITTNRCPFFSFFQKINSYFEIEFTLIIKTKNLFAQKKMNIFYALCYQLKAHDAFIFLNLINILPFFITYAGILNCIVDQVYLI